MRIFDEILKYIHSFIRKFNRKIKIYGKDYEFSDTLLISTQTSFRVIFQNVAREKHELN